jgi:hypothetical protein
VEQVENGDPAGMPFIEGGALSQLDLIPMLRSALTLIILILALFMLYRFVRRSIILMRIRWAERQDETGTYRSLSGLGQLLKEVFLGQAQEAAQGWSRRLNRRERARAAERIRNIYTQLLELSEDLGHSRPASITPLEFLPELAGQFPGLGVELRVITTAYNDIRYGELPETQRQLEAVEEAWRRVRLQGEANKKELKRGQREVQPV